VIIDILLKLTRCSIARGPTLLISRTQTNVGDRAFNVAGPRVRSYLRTDLWQLYWTVAED